MQCVQNEIRFYPKLPKELIVSLPRKRNFVTSFTASYLSPVWYRYQHSGSYFGENAICYPTALRTISGLIYHDNKHFDALDSNSIIHQTFPFVWSEPPLMWRHVTWEQVPLLGPPPTSAWKNVLFASSNSSNWYRGFANGAVQSGMRTALLALLAVRPQTVDWKDFNDIEHASRIRRHISTFSLLSASLNLYKCTWHGLVWTIGIYIFIKGRVYIKLAVNCVFRKLLHIFEYIFLSWF